MIGVHGEDIRVLVAVAQIAVHELGYRLVGDAQRIGSDIAQQAEMEQQGNEILGGCRLFGGKTFRHGGGLDIG